MPPITTPAPIDTPPMILRVFVFDPSLGGSVVGAAVSSTTVSRPAVTTTLRFTGTPPAPVTSME